MEGASSKKKHSVKNKSKFTKFLKLFLYIFGKKSKKSFSSVILHLLESYQKEDLITLEEKKMFTNMASFGDKKVASIMTPRADLVAIKQDTTLEEVKEIITSNGHTRIPVFQNNLDEIMGFIHSKDLAKFLCDKHQDFVVSKILRKILFVPGSMKLMDVMLRMRLSRIHFAIVLDEFGGVDGFVTIDNLMEEIVGNIEDEHDLPSDNLFFRIKKINNKTFQFGGRVEIDRAEEFLDIKIKKDEDEFETIGGLITTLFKRVPEVGEEIEKGNIKFKVIDADSRVVKLVEAVIS